MAEAGPSSQNLDPGGRVSKCNSPGCFCCQYIKDGISSFECTATGELYRIKQKWDCTTSNVIYVIECKRCLMQYVGKFTGRLQRRFRDHLSSIKKGEHRPIPDHYRSECHSLADVSVFPIEQVDGSKELVERELFWIRELDTVTEGLNLGRYKCVRQRRDDDSEGPSAPAQAQLDKSMETTPNGKRKRAEMNDQKSKRKKKNLKQMVYSPEMEELLSTCEDVTDIGKEAMSQIDLKLQSISCTDEGSKSLLKVLKKNASDLKKYDQKKEIYIGLFGRTGAGKSSLINAIINENQLLPSGSMNACTSAFVHVRANTESPKYRADIEFISDDDWESEKHFLQDLINQQKEGAETEMVEMAKEKIKAIYGQQGLEESLDKLVLARELREFLITGKKTVNFDTAKDLSKSIRPFIRSDEKAPQQFWPLVKKVTIYLPNSPALLDGIVLVDLPGSGDINTQRCEMWKECLSQCSSVWIVSDMNRALSEKEANEIFDKSLSTIAGGGVCHNITFIGTQTDRINPEEIKVNHHLTDDDLEIKCDTEDYEREEKQACIRFRNERFKEEISKVWKEKTKRFLLGDEDNSDEFFHVSTVSSEEYRKIAQGRKSILEKKETEIPFLIEHIKKLYVSHSVKEVKDFISNLSGIICYLHLSKDAISSKVQSSNLNEFTRLEKELVKTCKALDLVLTKFHNDLKTSLQTGAREAQITCHENAMKSVLEPSWSDNRGHHQRLKALCRNDGHYRRGNGDVVDLNYSLSEPMYKMMNKTSNFQTIFGSRSTKSSLNGHFERFQECFISRKCLESTSQKNQEKYRRLVYIRTEQRKLLRTLEKDIQQRKKQIYNSLWDSVLNTMNPTYRGCSEIEGKETLVTIKDRLVKAIEDSKSTMFGEATGRMLKKVQNLQDYLVDGIKKGLTMSLKVALNQIPDDLTGLPDVAEEYELLKQCCERLKLQIF